MSQYKVLPSYSEINTLNQEYEETSHFANFSLIYSHHTRTVQDLGRVRIINARDCHSIQLQTNYFDKLIITYYRLSYLLPIIDCNYYQLVKFVRTIIS